MWTDVFLLTFLVLTLAFSLDNMDKLFWLLVFLADFFVVAVLPDLSNYFWWVQKYNGSCHKLKRPFNILCFLGLGHTQYTISHTRHFFCFDHWIHGLLRLHFILLHLWDLYVCNVSALLKYWAVGHFVEQNVNTFQQVLNKSLFFFSLFNNSINWCHYFSSWQLVFKLCTTQALASFCFISNPPSASLLPWAEFFLLGSRPRASASSKVLVSGRPRVSGNNNVSTPIMNARTPTMSYTGQDE